jgi:hypothetical protein
LKYFLIPGQFLAPNHVLQRPSATSTLPTLDPGGLARIHVQNSVQENHPAGQEREKTERAAKVI